MFKRIIEQVMKEGDSYIPSSWKTIRTITTERHTNFNVFAETEHYVFCKEPSNSDTVMEAILDFEWMAMNGYFICSTASGFVIFEKRRPIQE